MNRAPPGTRVVGHLPAGTEIIGKMIFHDMLVLATTAGVFTCGPGPNDMLEKVVPRLKGGRFPQVYGDLL